MKLNKIMISLMVLILAMFATSMGEELSDAQKEAVVLVEKAGKLITEKGDEALKLISKPDGGFYFKDKALYAFIYDENCVMLAHPYKPELIGKSYKGKPDFMGKMFRDEIVEKALKEGSGWTVYAYQKPGDKGLFYKTVFGKLYTKDGKKYIVASGVYKDK